MSGQERPLPPVDNIVDLQETTESTRQPNAALRAGGTLAAVGALGMGLVAFGGGNADGEAAGWSPVESNDVFCVNDQLGYWQIVSSVRSDYPGDSRIDGQDFVATPGNFIDAELRDDEDEVLAYGVWGPDVDSANISFNITYPGAPGEVDPVSVSGSRPEGCEPADTTTTTSTTTTTTSTTTTTQPEQTTTTTQPEQTTTTTEPEQTTTTTTEPEQTTTTTQPEQTTTTTTEPEQTTTTTQPEQTTTTTTRPTTTTTQPTTTTTSTTVPPTYPQGS